jgi:SAM-dependent methyltransferase
LRSDGAQPVATVHLLSLLGRRWVRAAPTSPAHAALLEARGWRPGRWRRAQDVAAASRGTRATAADWDRAAQAIRPGYLDAEMAAVKRRAHLDLLARWVPDLDRRAVLKTDLWEEAIAGDELLFTLAARARAAHGVDVSPAVVAAATLAAGRRGVAVHLTAADVRSLPLADGAVDAVLSTSTLDHLVERDRPAAMRELRRVLSPGGVLVVTCDNVDNVSDGLLSAAAAARLVPFPLEPAVSLDDLRGLVEQAGLRYDDHAYLVHGPRVLTTLAVRALRALLPRSRSGRAVARLLCALERVGARHPRRMAAFVAVRATNPAAASDPPDRRD